MIKFIKKLLAKLFNLSGSSVIQDHIPVKGKVKLVLRGADGKVKTTRVSNTIQNPGKYTVADQLLASPTLGKPTHGGVGTGTPAGGDLGTPVTPRVALTSKTRLTNVLTMVFDLPAGVGTGTLIEAGIFDALTTGNCLATTTFSAIPKGAADTLEITWTWTIG